MAHMTNMKPSRPAVLSLVASLIATLPLTAALPFGLPAYGAASALPNSMPFADSAFESIWMRSDQPVASRAIARSWTWGPAPLVSGVEPYADAPDGSGIRLVQ